MTSLRKTRYVCWKNYWKLHRNVFDYFLFVSVRKFYWKKKETLRRLRAGIIMKKRCTFAEKFLKTSQKCFYHTCQLNVSPLEKKVDLPVSKNTFNAALKTFSDDNFSMSFSFSTPHLCCRILAIWVTKWRNIA